MQDRLTQLRERWKNLPQSARFGIIGGGIGLLVLFIALGFWAGSPTYTTLYTGLNPADSANVVQVLREKGIQVRTQGGGSVIEVPTDKAEEARLELASKGLPKSGAPGYSRLEQTPFGMTQTMEQNTLRIAMEEELQNTIQHLEPVERARVHITPGNDSPFADSRTEPSASIMVVLKPGEMLNRDQIKGIVHLVCHSVEGLKPENVTVVDSEARPLWNGGDQYAVDNEMVRLRREAERGYSEELRRQLQQHLDQVLGPNKSSVMVQSELNLDREEIQAQRVEPLDPNRAAVLSETSSTERLSGNPPAVGGAAGIAGNRADAPIYPTAPAVQGGEYNREDRVRNYEVNKQVEHIVRAPGRIERLSVAVLIDEGVDQAAVDAVRNWLETTVGVAPNNPTRTVTVQRVKFDDSRTQAEQAEQKARELAQRQALLWKLLPVVLLLIVTIFLARVIGKHIRRPVAQPNLQVAGALPGGGTAVMPAGALPEGSTTEYAVGEEGIAVLYTDGQPVPAGQGVLARSGMGEESELEEEYARKIRERNQPELLEIIRFAESKPEHVAVLLKNWIKS